jgi:hypothetical protein
MESMVRDRLLAKTRATRGFAEREIRHTIEAMLNGLAKGTARRRLARQ